MSDPFVRAWNMNGLNPARKLAAIYLSECVDQDGYLLLDSKTIAGAAYFACTTVAEVEAAIVIMLRVGILAKTGVQFGGREALYSPDRQALYPPKYPHEKMLRSYNVRSREAATSVA